MKNLKRNGRTYVENFYTGGNDNGGDPQDYLDEIQIAAKSHAGTSGREEQLINVAKSLFRSGL